MTAPQTQYTQREMETEQRLTRIEEKIDALGDRFSDVMITQLAGHDRRIRQLEDLSHWVAGWLVGSGLIGAGVAGVLVKYL